MSPDLRHDRTIKTEELAYWFFRLNGCLTIVNFLVHGERRGHEGTDADILAVRFPHRRELAMAQRPMEDHEAFATTHAAAPTDVMIAEVKMGTCALNGPWTDPERKNMHRVLYAMGMFPQNRVPEVADCLHAERCYQDAMYRVRLFAIGREPNPDLGPHVVQLTWTTIAEWIYDRLSAYRDIKAQHRQWDSAGQSLYRTMTECYRDRDSFVQSVVARLSPE